MVRAFEEINRQIRPLLRDEAVDAGNDSLIAFVGRAVGGALDESLRDELCGGQHPRLFVLAVGKKFGELQ